VKIRREHAQTVADEDRIARIEQIFRQHDDAVLRGVDGLPHFAVEVGAKCGVGLWLMMRSAPNTLV